MINEQIYQVLTVNATKTVKLASNIAENENKIGIMKITGKIITFAAAIMTFTAVSCSKDNTLRYNNMTMGNVINGTFVSDQGNTFNVVDQTCPGKLDTMQRAMIICDILNSVNGSETEYDVRLNFMSPVLTKDAIAMSEITNENLLINDPIILEDFWISGGYVNLYIMVPIKINSTAPHVLTFIQDDSVTEKGKYTFIIRHNANGETLKENSNANQEMTLGGAYASFPVASLIKENDAQVTIVWESYRVSGNAVLSDSEEKKETRLYSKNTYEQVPTQKSTEAEALTLR